MKATKRGTLRSSVGLKQRNPARGDDEMTMESVIEWLCVLRIPPFANVYKVLGPAASCPECGEDARFVAYTRSVFPGGSVSACKKCGATWLQESNV
jgi:hypothetical protein